MMVEDFGLRQGGFFEHRLMEPAGEENHPAIPKGTLNVQLPTSNIERKKKEANR
jgi:hypothetical protein